VSIFVSYQALIVPRFDGSTSSLKFFTVRETVVLEHMQGVPLHKSRGTVCLQVWGYVCYVCTQDACKV